MTPPDYQGVLMDLVSRGMRSGELFLRCSYSMSIKSLVPQNLNDLGRNTSP